MEQQLSVGNRLQATPEIIETYRAKTTSWRCLCLEVKGSARIGVSDVHCTTTTANFLGGCGG